MRVGLGPVLEYREELTATIPGRIRAIVAVPRPPDRQALWRRACDSADVERADRGAGHTGGPVGPHRPVDSAPRLLPVSVRTVKLRASDDALQEEQLSTTTGDSEAIRNHAAFIWSVADLLRGDYKQSEYGKVILPLTVIRRLDCVLEPTKDAVLERHEQLAGKIENLEPVLQAVAGQQFFNTSPLTFTKLLDDPNTIADSLALYIGRFSAAAKDVIDKFDFAIQIDRLRRANVLYQVIGKFAEIDLHPEAVSNIEMGYLFEELIRRFSELSNETAGEHFTPREVIRLMVNLLFIEDEDVLTKPGIVKTLCDPACGTGGMLSVAEDHLRALNPQARLEVFGQELNAETYAVCRSDMMLKGQDASHIAYGNSFSEDHHEGEWYDYLLANPPFGVEWKKVEAEVRKEAETKGFDGRFGAGLPRINDGSFLFLQHMIAKMKRPEDGGSRLAIVLQRLAAVQRRGRLGRIRDPPLDHRERLARSGRRAARPAVLQHRDFDLLLGAHQPQVAGAQREGAARRRARVLREDAQVAGREAQADLRRADRRDHAAVRKEFEEGEKVKIFPNEAFGFLRITVERPLRLRWEVTEENIASVLAAKPIQKLPEVVQEDLRELLDEHLGVRFATQQELVRELGSGN